MTNKHYNNFHKLIPFELFICEVPGNPWSKDIPKQEGDLRKLFRMLKDIHDLIFGYFYKKYGTLEYKNKLSIKSLEIFGIMIKGIFYFIILL